jgi:L-asparaginase
MKLKIFTTGGSIDKYYSTMESDFIVGDPMIADILKDANVSIDYEIESILKKDSLKITDQDRQQIFIKVKSDPANHVIITHGTDTMVETARSLAQVKGKVIVLTGAMQPAAFKQTDAAINIGAAIIAVQTLPEGVYLVMNGRVFDPNDTIKNLDLDQFKIM